MAKKLEKFVINNVFGIEPSKNYEAAGYDFYVPNIPSDISEDQFNLILNSFSKSYSAPVETLINIADELVLYVTAQFGEEFAKSPLNLLHLYCAVNNGYKDHSISEFVDKYLVFDANKTPGVWVYTSDHVKFNSGVRVKMPASHAGIFLNKSGRGTAGWDVRAQVVDEDYTGYVHNSMAFTAPTRTEKTQIYCGDKLVQMCVIPITKCELNSVSAEEFDELTSDSKRGDKGFGSGNEKH